MLINVRVKGADVSAQKARLVADTIRGKNVSQAVSILNFEPTKASKLIGKLLNSALANAENNYGMDIDDLCIDKIHVDEGPSMKRMMPRAKGRGDRIVKRSCHINLILNSK